MKFGPLDSPTKTIDLLNLVDHLRVVLAAIPFVSQAGTETCIVLGIKNEPGSSWQDFFS